MLLTARQPFTSPKAQDPMEVMRRIVDERWPIKYPPYMSDEARVRQRSPEGMSSTPPSGLNPALVVVTAGLTAYPLPLASPIRFVL